MADRGYGLSRQLPHPHAYPRVARIVRTGNEADDEEEVPRPPPSNMTYMENGRPYGSLWPGEYLFPLDTSEKNRMDIFQTLMETLFHGRLTSVPVNFTWANPNPVMHDDPYRAYPPEGQAPLPPRRGLAALDIGTGTGIWPLHMAGAYPNATVLGLDYYCFLQPKKIKPNNMRFWVMDVESRWDNVGYNWDLIHIRNMNGCIRSWPALYNQAFNALTPGHGFIEHIELDYTSYSDLPGQPLEGHEALTYWCNLLKRAMHHLGKPIHVADNYNVQQLRQAGFVDIKHEKYKMHLNPWSTHPQDQEIGRLLNVYFTEGLQALSMAPMTRGLGMDPREVNLLNRQVKDETCLMRYRLYFILHVWTARRPGFNEEQRH